MYGYCSHFMRVAAKLKPTHAASALDVSGWFFADRGCFNDVGCATGPTFRDNLYAQYKARVQLWIWFLLLNIRGS